MKTAPRLPACLFLLFAAPSLLPAQSGGFLTGVVQDRSGAILPGAEVRIQSESTGARQKLFCDNAGKYVSSELAPGVYKLTIRSRGFRTFTQPGIAAAIP